MSRHGKSGKVESLVSRGAVTTSTPDALMQALSSYNSDTTRGVDLYETAKNVKNQEETQLYDAYNEEFLTNDLAQFLVMNLVGYLMDFKFVSDDEASLDVVEDFFYLKNTNENLTQVLAHSFIFGTGIAQRFQVGTRLDNFVRVDSASITIEKEINGKGELIYEYTQTQNTDNVDNPNAGDSNKVLRAERIAAFRPMELPTSAYGVSLMRASLLPLQAIRQLNMDIPAGIKRLAYETMVAYVDLTGIPVAEQKTALKKTLQSFVKYDSATNTIVALDNRHKLTYVGTDGGGSQKIVPLMDIIEPIMIFLLNKWFVPLGDVLQEKSNRALSETQTSTSRQRLKMLKAKFARFIEREIITPLLNQVDQRPTVRVVHNVTFAERKEELTMLLDGYKVGAIPREVIQDRLDIVLPEGEHTYYMPDGSTYTTGDQADQVAAVKDKKPAPKVAPGAKPKAAPA